MSLRPTIRPTMHPALAAAAERRARDFQNRIADSITRFAGSMPFFYVHILWFSLWIAVGVEGFPYGFLTMLVSLEAIFLSTFVMISQNRADEKRQALADHHWELIKLEKGQQDDLLALVQLEKKQNEDILELSQKILTLTSEVHALTDKVHSLVLAPR